MRGVGVQFGQEWRGMAAGRVRGGGRWQRDCTRARENANRFSEGYTVQQRTSSLGSSLCEVKL